MTASITSFRSARHFGVLALVAALAACGGGGGGGDTTTPPTNNTPTNPGTGGGGTTTVVDAAGNLQTSVAASTYGVGSLAQSAFTALNTVRQSAGAGLVAQSAVIDVAADAHAKYLTTNIASGIGHDEDSTKVDFYAATVSERVVKAGYSANFLTEVIGGSGASALGSDCVLGLLNTVYHGAALLSRATTVGIGFGQDSIGIPMCVLNPATASTDTYGQVPAAGSVVAYPYNTQTGVFETFYVGYESPRPSAVLFPNLTAGTPVIVNVRNADYVNNVAAGTLNATVTAFNLKDAGGNIVPSAILANEALKAGTGVTLNTDGNLGAGFAVLVPLSPLAKGATYEATFTFTLKTGDTPVTKTWTFTTNP